MKVQGFPRDIIINFESWGRVSLILGYQTNLKENPKGHTDPQTPHSFHFSPMIT